MLTWSSGGHLVHRGTSTPWRDGKHPPQNCIHLCQTRCFEIHGSVMRRHTVRPLTSHFGPTPRCTHAASTSTTDGGPALLDVGHGDSKPDTATRSRGAHARLRRCSWGCFVDGVCGVWNSHDCKFVFVWPTTSSTMESDCTSRSAAVPATRVVTGGASLRRQQ